MNIRGYIPAFLLLCVIAVLHQVGMLGGYNHLGYDVVMHILGGVWVGLSAYWFVYQNQYLKKQKKDFLTVALYVIGSALVVGIVWEVFETVAGISVLPGDPYWPDTIKDLCMDTLGGIFVFLSRIPKKQGLGK